MPIFFVKSVKIYAAARGARDKYQVWLVGGCGAQAVSRKTPIYFMIHLRRGGENLGTPAHLLWKWFCTVA